MNMRFIAVVRMVCVDNIKIESSVQAFEFTLFVYIPFLAANSANSFAVLINSLIFAIMILLSNSFLQIKDNMDANFCQS